MSDKYLAIKLRKRVLDRLSQDFPTTLDAWDSSINEEAFATVDGGSRDLAFMNAIVNIFSDIDAATSLLPSAIFRCVTRQSPASLMHGQNHPLQDNVMLNPSAQATTILAWDRINQYMAARLHQWLLVDANFDCFSTSCHVERLELYASWAHGTWWPDDVGFLQPWRGRWGANLCGSCAEGLKKVFDMERKTLWSMLPYLCGMKEWDKLLGESTSDD